ncbi:MAG: ECF transporter S component [Clostridiales Family XIII bacterium]|jgi:uncharacterized membrane protein|nr:ECF transporter S component [Clostridiales Family XIII bacterium]
MQINRRTQKITITALMAAVIFVVTYIVRIPIPIASGGYLNIGDAPVYIAGFLLGGPWGAVAAAIGSALSDLAGGYVAYALPTAVVKGAMGFVCGKLMEKDGAGRFVLTAILGGAIMVGGYAGFEAVLFNANQALAAIPFNCIQWAGGVIVASALYPAICRLRSR